MKFFRLDRIVSLSKAFLGEHGQFTFGIALKTVILYPKLDLQ